MLTPEPKVYKEWTELLKITFKSSWGIAYKWVSITPLDIWSFIWLSDEDIVQKIKSELKIDINQEKSLWLKKLNYLFYKWVEYYKDEYGREKFWKNYAIDYLKQDFFSSKEDAYIDLNGCESYNDLKLRGVLSWNIITYMDMSRKN